jgi:hypothetical protein
MSRLALPTLLLGAALLVAGPADVGPATAHAQGCLSNSQAQALVDRGQSPPFSAYYASPQQQGQVVSSCMIQSGGGYKYKAMLRKPNGQVVPVIVP